MNRLSLRPSFTVRLRVPTTKPLAAETSATRLLVPRSLVVARSLLAAMLLVSVSALLLMGCDKEKEETEGRDWRPVIEQIDEALILDVMKAEGWTQTGEPHSMTLEAEAVREMGGQAAGDTHITSYGFEKGEMTASVGMTEFPGDVKPAEGDRGISLEESLLAAGSRGVGVSVYDADFAFQKEESEALLDAIIAAAEAKME